MMAELRQRVRAIILGITGFIVALLLIRFFLSLLAADTSNALIQLIWDVTNPLVEPFIGSAVELGSQSIEASTFVALIVYIVLGILISEIVTGFLQDSFREILINVLDAFFKVIEFLLISRLVLMLFGFDGNDAGGFVASIYAATAWSAGILPEVEFMQGKLEFSTIAMLIIVVIIDLATEGLIGALFPARVASPKVSVNTPPPSPQTSTTVIKEVPRPLPAAQPQNITINVPVNNTPVRTVAVPVDRQQVRVLPGPRS